MNTMKRKPTHPGIIIKEDYLQPLSLSVKEMALNLGVSRKTLSKLLMEEVLLRQTWRFVLHELLIRHRISG